MRGTAKLNNLIFRLQVAGLEDFRNIPIPKCRQRLKKRRGIVVIVSVKKIHVSCVPGVSVKNDSLPADDEILHVKLVEAL